jgi:predicted nucleotidyltransferase
VNALVGELGKWARRHPQIRALALVGSWASGKGRIDSDIDVLLLSANPEAFTASDHWLDHFGKPPVVRREQFGQVAERRIRLPSELEVEFDIAPLSWAQRRSRRPGHRQSRAERHARPL